MSTPDEMAAKMVANMKEKTGKSLPQWLKVTLPAKLEKHGQIVKLLKDEHGVTHGYASVIAHETLRGGGAAPTADGYVANQYAGKKEALRPIYDTLVAAIVKLGKDVDVSPRKTYVTLRRNKQFGLIQATTATRVDVGLNLRGVSPGERLEASGSFNSMCTHRVRLTSKKDIDAELKRWLKQAYEAS